MPFLANIKQLGAMKYRDVLGSIGFRESSNNAMPIGQIDYVTWDENGLPVWKLNIGGQNIEGDALSWTANSVTRN